MKYSKDYETQSQQALPFLETDRDFLPKIFETLEFKFGLKKDSTQRFADLGSGNGRVIIEAGLSHSIHSYGFEINSNLIQEAKALVKQLKKEKKHPKSRFKKIRFEQADLFQLNLNNYDYIYIFSLPSTFRFLNHVFLTAKKGAVIISFKFPFELFENYLKLEFVLDQKIENKEIYTYFYKKFV